MNSPQKKSRGRPRKIDPKSLFALWNEYVTRCARKRSTPSQAEFCTLTTEPRISIRTLRRALRAVRDSGQNENKREDKNDETAGSEDGPFVRKAAKVVVVDENYAELPPIPMPPTELLRSLVGIAVAGKGPHQNPTLALRQLVAENFNEIRSLDSTVVALVTSKMRNDLLKAKRVPHEEACAFGYTMGLNASGVFEKCVLRQRMGR